MKKVFYHFLCCATIALMFASNAFAQTGSIKGQIMDSTLNEALIGATIQLENTTIGASADVEGNYQITGVQVGTYTLVCTMVGYQTQKIEGIQVQAGKVTLLNVNLKTEANALGEVVLTVQRETMGELAVISEIKGAEQVAVGMSGEQISKTQDRDAAQVVRRIAGVSIFDDRFIMIRGLSQRYNTVMLNDAIAPSSEVDIRAFSFDMLPSSAIDRILIYKSGAGELPGEFAGGVVKVYTKLAPTENFTSIGVGTGFRLGTTFQNGLTYKGTPTDMLGFDNGSRALPAGMPNTKDFKRLQETNGLRATSEWGNKMNNNWNITNQNISPDLRLNYTMGRRFTIGNAQVGNLTALAYSNTKQKITDGKYIRYGDLAVNPTDIDANYVDNTTSNNVRFSAISNWSVIFNRYNKIEFRNFFNQMGSKETLQREGRDFEQGGENQINRQSSLRFEQRSIYSSQLSGKHNVGGERSVIKWLAGFGYTHRQEPDFKRYLQTRTINPQTPFTLTTTGPSSRENSRFFTRLNEYVFTGSVNYELALEDKEENENPSKFRAGIYTENKSRTFNSRTLGYTKVPNFNPLTDLTASPEVLFSNQNADGNNAFGFTEITNNKTDSYKATNLLIAPYASLYYKLTERFSASVGARLEYNDQQILLDSIGGFTNKKGGKAIASFLPSVNLTYNLTDKSLIRLAYSSSINRPEFRELVGFSYYEPNLDAIQVGNPYLGVARINNVDLRWEFYPTPSETITFGAFYKYFKNPIENQIISTNGPYTYSFLQADNAQTYGIETEIRKGFANASGFFKNITFVLNASYLVSNIKNQDKITFFDGTTSPTEGTLPKNRIMFGQSPYLINGGIFYNNEESKLQVNVLYNVFGRRLFAIGNITDSPSQYEMPRHSLDLTVSKGFGKGFEVRFGAQELLNPAFRIVEDFKNNGKGKLDKDEKGATLFENRRGQYFTLALGYKF
ncbi:MAG: TonB-dependent receptor [Bacteroidetes bacterium]|nr:MAG: TonB-dependent receptor [Bacteroidota bacterium]